MFCGLRRCGILSLALVMLAGAGAGAAEGPEDGLDEVKRQVEVLSEEIEKIKLGAVAESTYESYAGLGPAASKVYFAGSGLSIGGYGEAVYQNFTDSSIKDYADAYRFIIYAGYKFNDWIVMNTELELEHAGINNVGGSSSGISPSVSNSRSSEVYVEFSYLDFLLSEKMSLSAGLMLMPIGFINEYHEPTVFNGVLRPDVETNIIPSTWRELGVMAHGASSGLGYKLALVNGLRADRFSSGSWIRNGRQQGAGVDADAGAVIANLNYALTDSLRVGGTYYIGKADHGRGKDADPLGEGEWQATASLWEVHWEYKYGGLGLRALFARGALDGNAAMASAAGNVGKEVQGWYAEAGYDLMPVIRPGAEMALTPFARYESYDTNMDVFTGSRDPMLDRTVATAGVGFKPHPNVVLKADYQWRDTASDSPEGKGTGFDENKADQVNVGIGFIF